MFELPLRSGDPAGKFATALAPTANADCVVRHCILKRIRDLLPKIEEIR